VIDDDRSLIKKLFYDDDTHASLIKNFLRTQRSREQRIAHQNFL
jgi:hypothetical protein